MKNRLLLIALYLLFIHLSAMAIPNDTVPKYIKVDAGYLMVLRQGENIFEALEKFAQNEQIPSANFTGMGFVNVSFGYFNNETKKYEPKDFSAVELASMTGSIAWDSGKPSLHVHGVATGKDFQAFGGHMLSAKVGTGSVEIMIIPHSKELQRKKEEPLDANVLQLK